MTHREVSRTIEVESISARGDPFRGWREIVSKNMRFLLSVAIVVFLAGQGVTVRAQSLADVARQEEERRKTVKPVTRVLTNTDLGSVPPAVVTPPPPDAAKVAEAEKTEKPSDAAPPQDKDPVRDQAYWGARMKELRTQLDRDQIFAEAIQTRINSLTADFVNRDDPAQRGVIERDRQRAIAELDRLTKAIADGKKAIADLEEEARRAGAPPGWLR